jgi:hypothetical protein
MTKSKRQPYIKGGVASLRQPFFLGKIAKKIGRGVKKIVKSPIGKAALIGASLYGLNRFGLPGSGAGKGWWGKGLSKLGIGAARGRQWGINDPMRWSGAKNKSGILGGAWNWMKGNPGKAALLAGGAGLTALPFLGQDPEEDVVEEAWDVTPSSIANIKNMARNRDPSLSFLPPANYVQSGFYAADGGIARLANGGQPAEAQAEQMLRMEYQKYRNQGGTMSYQQFKMAVLQQAQAQGPMAQGQQTPMAQPQMAAHGGRMGYQGGEMVTDESMVAETPTGMMEESVEEVQGEPSREQLEVLAMEIFQLRLEELDEEQLMVVYQTAMEQQPQEEMMQEEEIQFAANGGVIGSHVPGYTTPPGYNRFDYPSGGVRVGRAEGGIMDLGGMEKDYRNEGGFVALGGKEKADDVPARLSKNEFVFTADAVRNAGGGDIDQGAEVMQNMMENLEAGGEISEESQGAQGMYDNMQQLQSRIV